jgi:hypothetical protein
METLPRDEAKRLMRAKLLSFEQLASGQTESAPARPDGTTDATPKLTNAAQPARRASDQPIEISQPVTDPCHRVPVRSLNDPSLPSRSRLSPSQRAQLHRPVLARDRSERLGYVTYTVDPRTVNPRH